MNKAYLLVFALIAFSDVNAQTTLSITADKDNTIYSAFTANSNGAGEYLFAGKTLLPIIIRFKEFFYILILPVCHPEPL